MIYFSALLQTTPSYKAAATRLFAALDCRGIPYTLLQNTRDIWLRDFMPVKTGTGRHISFRYEPRYLKKDPQLRTDFRREIAPQLPLQNLVYSHINLDGGNVVFSPSKTRAIISDRVFEESDDLSPAALVRELERLLEARVIIIPSLRSDMTGHADGMVRFIDETTAVGNRSVHPFGLERRIQSVLHNHGIDVVDFPFFSSPKDSAVGCYLNFLDTETHLLLPVFGAKEDSRAIATAEGLFHKPVVPIDIREIAQEGGVLNCISWEMG